MKYILATLAFYALNSGWHTFDRRCKKTRDAIYRLRDTGYLEVNGFYQARFIGEVFV